MASLIDNILQAKNNGGFSSYIDYIRFPSYKNLEPNLKITFDFPLTILVGANGSNKTSILHALYGCPHGYSTGDYWFSTPLDIIIEEDASGKNNCHIHAYTIPRTNDTVEVLKTRIKKNKNPDYWEPSRPVQKYGMIVTMPTMQTNHGEYRSQTRWNPIKKNVLYLNFREMLCAYDKYFYFGDLKTRKTIKTKQDYIRYRSRYLREIADKNLTSYKLRGKERLKGNITLEKDAIDCISHIIGKKYLSIRILKHLFFEETEGSTVLLTLPGQEYSEAFAGSGESAIVIAVSRIMEAEEGSLILLDEPETSLHPGAQTRFRDFLLKQMLCKKHQVVISTHSREFVEGLPHNALKVLFAKDEQRISIKNETNPEEAFKHIGSNSQTNLKIIVEDKLAENILEHVIVISENLKNLSDIIEIAVFPGGAETIINSYLIPSAIAGNKNAFFLLDGDKRHNENFEDPDSIPSNVTLDALKSTLSKHFVQRISLPASGNGGASSEEECITSYKKILKYLFQGHLKYLPIKTTPEEFLLENSEHPSTM